MLQDKAYDRLPTERSRALRNNPTDAERQTWNALRNRQVPIGPFICDFVARSAKLVIEVDGGQHAGQSADLSRTRFLQDRGYRVLRFWNNDVLGNIEGVVTTIAESLNNMPSPNPSRQAGGEEPRRGEGSRAP